MRLIDADELSELFYKEIEDGATDLMDAFDFALEKALTVDAVPVVRCEKCKFLGGEIIRGQHNCRMENIPYCVSDDFCSYGEQSEE